MSKPHKPVADGTLVRVKEWGTIGRVAMSVNAGQATAIYWVRSALNGEHRCARDGFTLVRD